MDIHCKIPVLVDMIGAIEKDFVEKKIENIRDKNRYHDLEFRILEETKGDSLDDIINFSNIIFCTNDKLESIKSGKEKSLNTDEPQILIITDNSMEIVVPNISNHKKVDASETYYKYLAKIQHLNKEINNITHEKYH
jgi:hypothetical protein